LTKSDVRIYQGQGQYLSDLSPAFVSCCHAGLHLLVFLCVSIDLWVAASIAFQQFTPVSYDSKKNPANQRRRW